jgi:hypothetical protein
MSRINDQTWRNVHTYDTQLQNIFFPQHESTTQKKIELFSKMINSMTNPVAKNMVSIIIDNVKNKTNITHDGIEQSDLLFEIVMVFEKGDLTMIKEVEEQLADTLLSGQCPSGRITRLLQLWRSIYGIVEDIEFRSQIHSLTLSPVSNEEKKVLFSHFWENINSTPDERVKKLVKNMITDWENNHLVYYDGIEQSFMLGNTCKKLEKDSTLLEKFYKDLRKISIEEKLNLSEVYNSMIRVLKG